MAFVINPDELEGWPLHEGIEKKVVVNGQNMTALMATWAPKTRFAVHIHPPCANRHLPQRGGDLYH